LQALFLQVPSKLSPYAIILQAGAFYENFITTGYFSELKINYSKEPPPVYLSLTIIFD
jgi:hypothetical protein